ncbi:MAG: DUF3426 domain-containing protein [Alphaproteobacteria bacterium]
MITTCPACSTKYRQTETVEMGDAVECSVCHYDWIVSELNTSGKKKNASIDKINQKLKEISANQKRVNSTTSFILGSVAIILLVIVFAKNKIADTFPAMKTFYAKFGLITETKQNKVFIFLSNSTYQVKNGKNTIVISGAVRNIHDKALSKPEIIVELLDLNNKIVETRSFKLSAKLNVKEAKVFKFKIEQPPITAVDVRLKFKNN